MKPAEKIAILRLIRTQNIGPVTLTTLLRRFKSGTSVIEHLPEIGKRSKISLRLHSQAQAEDEIAKVNKYGGQIIVRGEAGYPDILKFFDDAPGCLTCLGHPHIMQKNMLSIVGSRNASLNALNLTRNLAHEIGAAGFNIVSGMARGIDAAAHEGSLDTGSIAVMAGGIDQIYPKENAKLYERLKHEGLILSEMPFGMQPFAQHFPIRNRIIASLGAGLLVIEANLKSGSLITAREAGDRGRDVMAIPGSPLDPRSKGCNKLLREGAILVEHAGDVIDVIKNRFLNSREPNMPLFTHTEHDIKKDADNDQIKDTQITVNELNEAKRILKELLSFDASPVDELVKQCHFSIPVISTALFEMELSGDVVRHYGNRISLVWSPDADTEND